ncbi:MAG TPA: ABC transporter substrate-binding protein [Terriglobales bacterium]|jgi:ABC-type nitrate/sulfonate/bicarbonate transport system substrate-binding protein|nr:ABC transporter substrate-binding protein [Terriglobales bacterium]
MNPRIVTIIALVLLKPLPTPVFSATKVTIGHSTINPRIAPLWVAQEKGFFQKYGIDATLIFVRNTPIMIAGMKAGSVPIAYGGGSGILGASVTESDLRVLATFTGRMTNNVVARPGIKTPKDLRGKMLGIQGLGGTNWMAALLWLEHFGLDLRRDNISLQGTGEQVVRAQALESGKVDAAVIDMSFSKKLEERGFNVIGDAQKVDIPFTGVDIVTTRGFIADQPALVENLLKALLESLAYVVTPKNQPAVVELIMKKLRIKETVTAEEGYHDVVRTMARKPFPSIAGMHNVQRLLKTQNPKIGEVNIEDLVDSRFMRKLDESGFIDRLYANSAR